MQRVEETDFPINCRCGIRFRYPSGIVEKPSRLLAGKQVVTWKPAAPAPRQAVPTEGPGTELKKLFDELGVKPKRSCQCDQRMKEMNQLGVEGCKRSHARILYTLMDAYDEASIATKATALAMALSKGLPLTLEGLLDEAIRRAS